VTALKTVFFAFLHILTLSPSFCSTSMGDSNQKHPPSFPLAYTHAFENSPHGDGSPGDNPMMCLDVVAAVTSRVNHIQTLTWRIGAYLKVTFEVI
jgi:hypothetical protein